MQLLPKTFALLLACAVLSSFVSSAQNEKSPDIDRLIRQLGDEEFTLREEATAQLAKVGAPALAALKKAAQSQDSEIKLRSAALVARIEKELRGELLTISGQPGYWLNRVAFTKDGKHAIATGGGVIWYDLQTGKEVRRVLERNLARPGLALSKDGLFFVTSHQNDNDIHIGKVLQGEVLGACKGPKAGVWAVAFSPDGAVMASSGDDKTIRLWDAKTFKEVHKIDHGKHIARAIAFSPDGKLLASGVSGGGDKCFVLLWDAKTGESLKSLEGHRNDVSTVLFTQDGNRLLSAGHDGVLILWDIDTGKELKRMTHGADSVIYHAALSPDGKRALTAGFRDRSVRLWDLEKGQEIRRFDGHPGAVLDVAFSPDGKRALSSDSQCTIKLWKLPE